MILRLFKLCQALAAMTLLAFWSGTAQADPPCCQSPYAFYPAAPVPGPAYSFPPVANDPLAPVVHSQNYSFYTLPKVTYYPPAFSSQVPTFPSANTYYETNLLAPYNSHTSGYQANYLAPFVQSHTSPKSTFPYYTPLYFRY